MNGTRTQLKGLTRNGLNEKEKKNSKGKFKGNWRCSFEKESTSWEFIQTYKSTKTLFSLV